MTTDSEPTTIRAVANDEDRLADELASLRIDKDRRGGPETRSSERRSGVGSVLVTLVVVAVLAVGGFFVWREGQGRMFPEEAQLGLVTLVSPAQEDVTLVATGYVYARKKATVAPKMTGRLARLFAAEGDEVKEGQIIAELESSDPHAQLAQLRAEIAAAQAKVERARADLVDAEAKMAREKELVERQAGTQAAFDDAKLRTGSAKAMLRAAEADVSAVQARQSVLQVALENTKVRAPFNGTVIRKLSEIGEVVSPASLTTTGASGLFIIASLDDLEVQADVAEAQFSKVKAGTPAEIILDAFPDRRFRGQVSEIRQTVDRAKAAVTVKVKFLDAQRGILPDMAAKVSFLARALDEAALKAAPKLVAPADAIADRGGQKVLFLVEDGHARAMTVKLGAPMGVMIELISGPTTGTKVVRHPGENIRDGVAIKEKK